MSGRAPLAGLGSSARLLLMVAAGLIAALITGFAGEWGFALLVGWDVAALTFTATVWIAVAGMDADSTAEHANREDPSRPISDVIVLIAAVASLAGRL